MENTCSGKSLASNSQVWPPRQRRTKYTANACTECKRRKIKCSGEQPCRGCTSGRPRRCTYDQPALDRLSTCQLMGDYTPDGNDGVSEIPTQKSLSIGVSQPLHNNFQQYITSNPSLFVPQFPADVGHFAEGRVANQRISFPAPEEASPQYISSQLFSEPRLGILLQTFFDELEYYYPILDRISFYQELSLLFSNLLPCGDGAFQVPLSCKHILLIALTCKMLSIAAYLGGGDSGDQLKGDEYYIQISFSWHMESRRLLELRSWNETPELGYLLIQVLEVIHMSMLGRKGDYSRAMAFSVDLAFSLQLNNEQTWSSLTIREQEYRRLLWWTIYLLDRRVAFLVGRPYLIRDDDIMVTGFTPESRGIYLCNNVSVDQAILWEMPSGLTEDWFNFLQFNSRWTKIATRVWDGFFSLRKSRSLDPDDLELIDALLLKLQSDLPPCLTWNSSHLPALIKPGNEDRSFRLRISILERVNLLRLYTRTRYIQIARSQRTDEGSLYAAKTAQDITTSTLKSMVAYLKARDVCRPWTTYGSNTLVETTKWVVPVLKSQHGPSAATYEVIGSMLDAQECLYGLGKMQLTAAHMALQRLGALVCEVRSAFPDTIGRSLQLEPGSVVDEKTRQDPGLQGNVSSATGGQSHWGLEEFLLGAEWKTWLSPSRMVIEEQ